jgi:hypothetical protein
MMIDNSNSNIFILKTNDFFNIFQVSVLEESLLGGDLDLPIFTKNA